MPGKGRRVASQQARLGQRRRRQGRGPATLPPRSPAPQPDGSVAPAPTAPSRPAPLAAPAPVARSRPEPRTAVLGYIGPELKRIAVVGGVTLVALIVLSIVLS